jgi:four helix bundle protein
MEKTKKFTFTFEKLEVWQIARKINNSIYRMTKSFPSDERYGLSSQIRRSISSVMANIAEGSGRSSQSDRAHFYNMAFSSALESLNHLIVAADLQYIDEKSYLILRQSLEKLTNKLNALYIYQLKSSKNLKNNVNNR